MSDDNSTDLPHLLVVDDSRLMRRAIIKILGQNNYRVTEAGDGEEGWKALQADDSIQVVFSDLSMPELDGYGLLERIRSCDEARIKNIAVIIITGAEDDEKTKQKALDAGASDFISKPFDSVQLKTRTQTHVQAAATSRELSKTTEVLEQKSEQLEKSSTIDSLTGLANKIYFEQRGNKDIAYAKRHRGEIALLRIDIDNFNKLYTTHGKEPANFILKKISAVLLDGVRQEDTISRIGVAKLACIMPQANRIGAKQFSERIRAEVENTDFEFGGIILPVTLSIGVATIDIHHETSLDDFVAVAEKHLATALSNGGNCIVVGDHETADSSAMESAVDESLQEPAAEVPSVIEKTPGIDESLNRIKHNESETLDTHLAKLLQKLLPLLELCNSKLNLGIDEALARIRQEAEK
jgi:diguanylate cyclase (GGDEF)-like protein